ncbi:endonuclease [uncultured Thiodictyon sp.]|uniref:endonuclease n=1 Tax=uncultured Thiodictyon sp. TaxID=1846217 RepID=UPI0025FDD960|nr:endonuclease [uncultured Thiodictyon sp.]
MARKPTVAIGFFAAIVFSSAFAANTPCSGKKGGVAGCQNGAFLCRDGSVSTSKQVCTDAGVAATPIPQTVAPAAPASNTPTRGRSAAPPGDLPRTAATFTQAKKLVYERIYFDHQRTLYCGCQYDADRQVALDTCGLQDLASNKRAARIEAEHVFPAAQFGNFRTCWREPASFPQCHKADGETLSGRECCLRVDPVFVAAHNDLQNLYPEDGYLNGRRSDYNWGMVSGGTTYGTCDMRFDGSVRRVQPPVAIRGEIARTMFYMRDTYGFRLSRQDQQLYTAWNNQNPPDDWEIERNRRIKEIQGMGNAYVEEYRRL